MRTKASGTWPPCRRLKTNYISKTVPHGSLSLSLRPCFRPSENDGTRRTSVAASSSRSSSQTLDINTKTSTRDTEDYASCDLYQLCNENVRSKAGVADEPNVKGLAGRWCLETGGATIHVYLAETALELVQTCRVVPLASPSGTGCL